MPENNFPIPVLNNKNRCPYMAIHLGCNVGGYATVECFRPEFHKDCRFKKKADDRYERTKSN